MKTIAMLLVLVWVGVAGAAVNVPFDVAVSEAIASYNKGFIIGAEAGAACMMSVVSKHRINKNEDIQDWPLDSMYAEAKKCSKKMLLDVQKKVGEKK